MEEDNVERRSSQKEWTYAQFKRFLLEQNFDIDDLPHTIYLNGNWHQAIAEIVRRPIFDLQEWAFAITKATRIGGNQPDLFFHGPVSGTTEQVEIPYLKSWAYGQKGFISPPEIVGAIHTHPIPVPLPLWAGDLYPIFVSEKHKAEMIATRFGNFLAVRSHDTPLFRQKRLPGENKDDLERSLELSALSHWYAGIKAFFRYSELIHPYWMFFIAEILQGTINVCKLCKIGLYYGPPNSPLSRLV